MLMVSKCRHSSNCNKMKSGIGFRSDLITDLKWIAFLLVWGFTQGYHDYHSVLINCREQCHVRTNPPVNIHCISSDNWCDLPLHRLCKGHSWGLGYIFDASEEYILWFLLPDCKVWTTQVKIAIKYSKISLHS